MDAAVVYILTFITVIGAGYLIVKYIFRMALKDIFEDWLKLSFLLSILITLPFAFLTVLGQIENEAGLILIFPFVAGLPWILIYMKLPFDIAGLNSPASGALNLVQLFFMMLPVYINIFLINFIVSRLMTRKDSVRK
ncbi:MAG: hypothetical protein JRF02_06965 [Deltaproteobacteria bacterium]|jgi:hypothetical protein|nr:hypothetical protein [Deltaproteobacteria bacterium]